MLMVNPKVTTGRVIVDVRQVYWSKVKPGDEVYIAGNLVDGFPTRVYGPHKVVDPKKQLLMNIKQKREFTEGFPFVYKELQLK
jgi:hypothetical protein